MTATLRARGFTLMEAMVALAISAVVVAAGAMSVTHINDSIQDTKKRAQAWDAAKRLQEYLTSQMQSAGGGVLRPFQAITVQNNLAGCVATAGLPPCDGSDRIELLTVAVGLPQCRVLGTSGVNLNVDAPAGVCCLDAPLSSAFEGRYAVLVGDNGTFLPLYLNTRTGACSINAPGGLGLNPGPGVLGTAAPGTLIAVDHRLFVMDKNTHRLWMWRDDDGDRAASGIERTALFDGVYDLQIALGYDGNPADGREVDTASDTDEWLYNHPADPALGVGAFLPVTPDGLRMVQVAVTVAAKARLGAGLPAQILDGPALPGVPGRYHVSTTSKAYLRNVNIFTP